MAFTFDVGTDIGKVRLLVPDSNREGGHVFEDAEIQTFIDIEGALSLKNAAALALETIAASQALCDKVLKLGDVETDGAKLLDSLLKRAKLLRSQAAMGTENELPFATIEQAHGVFGPTEVLNNARLRGVV